MKLTMKEYFSNAKVILQKRKQQYKGNILQF